MSETKNQLLVRLYVGMTVDQFATCIFFERMSKGVRMKKMCLQSLSAISPVALVVELEVVRVRKSIIICSAVLR